MTKRRAGPVAAGLVEAAHRPGPRLPVERLLSYLPSELVKTPGIAVLDVGCWDGDLLAAMSHAGARRGIEPNPDAAARARARGLGVDEGFVEDITLDAASYDLVTAVDVIEHLPQPRETVARLADALRPGGHLIVLTGNVGGFGGRFWRSDWYYLHYPEHVSFFTKSSIESTIRGAGLVPVTTLEIAHPSASAWRDLGGAVRHAALRRSLRGDVSLRPRVGFNLLTLSRLLRRRDHLLAVARKP